MKLTLRVKKRTDRPAMPRTESLIESIEVPVDGIHSLKIRWISIGVQVAAYDGDVILVQEFADRPLDDADRIHTKVESGCLTVSWRRNMQNIHGDDAPRKRLTVQLPRQLAKSLKYLDANLISGDLAIDGVAVDDCQISLVSASLTAADLMTGKLNVSGVSSSIDLNGITAKKLNVETVSGSVEGDLLTRHANVETVSGSVRLQTRSAMDELNVETVSGSVRICANDAVKAFNVNTVSGGIHLLLPEEKGFRLHFHPGNGCLQCDFPTVIKNHWYIFGDGQNVIQAETVSGHCTIEKNKQPESNENHPE